MTLRRASNASKVSDLVILHGRDKARDLLEPKDQHLVEIATKVLDDFRTDFGRVFSGWCLTGLPHKQLPAQQPWILNGDVISLVVTPGTLVSVRPNTDLPSRNRLEIDDDGYMTFPDTGERVYVEPEHRGRRAREIHVTEHGVPYGAHARLILHFLQKRALKTNNRRVELGGSLRSWLQQMGVQWGGNTIKQFQDQAQRIAASHMVFQWMQGDAQGWGKGGYLQMGERLEDGEPKVWDDEVVLDPLFFAALRRHGTPVNDAAIRALQHRSMSLDIYTFLAWRLHVLTRPIGLPWSAVKEQFGRGFAQERSFRQKFAEALFAALAAYPRARVDVRRTGIILYPARPPVSEVQVVGYRLPARASASAAPVNSKPNITLVPPHNGLSD